jgi:hypothetical protein
VIAAVTFGGLALGVLGIVGMLGATDRSEVPLPLVVMIVGGFGVALLGVVAFVLHTEAGWNEPTALGASLTGAVLLGAWVALVHRLTRDRGEP